LASVSAVAIGDLVGSIGRLPLAISLALDDVHGRYRRTILGPLWIVLGQAAMIGGFAIVFSGLFRMDPATYLLFLAAGFPIWTMISQFLVDMPSAFIAAKGVIESYELPWLIHIWRRSFAYVLLFLHHLLIFFVAMAVMQVAPSMTMLFVIPGLLVIIVAGSGVGMMLAALNARYRDLQPAMSMIAGVLMLISPVIWRPEQLLHLNQWVVALNPLHYYIKLLRDPLLGVAPTAELWIGTSLGAIVLFALGFLTFLLSRRRLYHWL
jgi:ABC-type polysaccharide/polyol phosphate export permease